MSDYQGPVTIIANGEERVLAADVWPQSTTLSTMIEGADPSECIPMQMSWGAPALAKCIEFMEAAALFEREAAVAEDRELWRAAWVLPFSEQSALPLLFQTMSVANYLGVQLVVDTLARFTADLVAQRTPNEILAFFGVRNEATWEEERELISTHSWIDPEGLIAKDREKRLAERASEEGAHLEAVASL